MRSNLQVLSGLSYEILDSLSDAIFVQEKHTAEYLAVNLAFTELYGYKIKDLSSLSFGDLSQGEAPYSVHEARDLIQKAQREGIQKFTWNAKHKDGHNFWVSVTLSLAILDGEERLLSVVRDIDAEKKAQLELEQAEQRFRCLFTESKAVMFLMDPKGNRPIIDANDSAVDFYGYPKEELIGMPINRINILPPDKLNEKLKLAVQGSGNKFNFPHRLASGEVRNVVVYPSLVNVGRQALIFTIVHDMTDVLKTELALENKVNRLQVLQETGKIVSSNDDIDRIARKVVKLMHTKLNIERCAIKLENSNGDLLYAASIGLSETYKSAIERIKPWLGYTREPTPFIVNDVEESHEFDSTSKELIDEGISSTLMIPLMLDGQLVGKLNFYSSDKNSFAEDDMNFGISVGDQILSAVRRSRDEAVLRQSEELFRAVTEQSGEGMGLIDQDGNFVLVNPMLSMMTFYSRKELISLEFNNLLTDITEQHSFDALVGADPGYHPYFLTRKDGSIQESEIASYSVIIGQDTYLLCVIHDVSERNQQLRENKKLEQSIQHTQKLESLGVLAGGIAHDFNNLLTGILGNAGVLHMEVKDQPVLTSCVHDIESSAETAAGLCKQLLAYSGRGKFSVGSIVLNDLIKEVAVLIESSISKKVHINFHLDSDLPAIEVDQSQMHQVVMNLLINASDALDGQQGQIDVTTGVLDCSGECNYCTVRNKNEWAASYISHHGEFIYLSVKDTGTGMSMETMNKIFEPFFTTKFTGRGLGLAAMQGIIKGHHGSIKVISELGLGSEFVIVLPNPLKNS